MHCALCSVQCCALCIVKFAVLCIAQCLVCSVVHCAVQILSVGQMVQESHMAGDTGSTREGECIFATKIISLHNVTISTLQCDNNVSAI